MGGFPASFLLLFYQVALGGLFAIAAAPFHELERGFYKSTAGVLFVAGVLGFLGNADIYLQSLPNGARFGAAVEILFYFVFLCFFALYLYSLWGERALFRARTFSLSLFTGLTGLALSSHAFYQAPLWSLEALLYPLSFFLSALLLGGVTVGMLIGHWYLIDTGQSIDPFIRIYRFFLLSLLMQILSFLIFPLLLYVLGNPKTILRLQQLWEEHHVLLWARLLIGQIAPLIISAMIWRTLKIPHTMAATGLFYIALLGVFVGEILGRQILALTSLPF
ncbi:MAG: hypothetical protein HYY45_21085 [Deltaproteobacteria bacterium]|nr:hypothetical protein [Deltaproteobacteria bacterium]